MGKELILWSINAAAMMLFSLMVFVYPAFGQLQLTSFSPDHGSTDVGTDVAIELVFSDPLDTSAQYDITNGFYLGIEVIPEPADSPTTELTNGDRMVTAHFVLETDTQYWVFLSGAQSTTGQSLDRPYVFTFSTGTVLPTGSVSGQVTYVGGEALYTAVGLTKPGSMFQDDEGENGSDEDVNAFAVVRDPSGVFTIDYVAAGEYILMAIQDTNQDGQPNEGEGFGVYDADANRIADTFTVAEGEQLDGFDVSLQTIVPVTAQTYLSDATAYAKSVFVDAVLIGAFGIDVTRIGFSTYWGYNYYSSAAEQEIGVVLFSNLLFEMQDDDHMVEGSEPVLDGWLDSDVIMEIAEANGGSEFRAANPDTYVYAFLGAVIFGDEGQAKYSNGSARSSFLRRPLKDVVFSLEEARIPWSSTQTADWSIIYFAEEDMMFFVIDAYTGQIKASPGQQTAALLNRDLAESIAADWVSDVQLMAVGVVGEEGINPSGESSTWAFSYHSTSLNQGRNYYLSAGFYLGEEEIPTEMFPSLNPLPSTWIDSPEAAAEADANSENFRGQYGDALVFATLSRGQRQSAPERPVWRFTYYSDLAGALKVVDVDAVSGLAITAVDEASPLPDKFVLFQAFPNPFNPSTTITFQLPEMERIQLRIFNSIGQEITKLCDAVLPAGEHSVTWHSNGLPGGVYFCRLESRRFQRIRSLILLK